MKVLLVNDCKFESMIIKDILNSLGYSAEITNEYNIFIDINRYEPDIVISNLIMRDTRGDELIGDIKEKYPNIKCILSSSSIDELEHLDTGVDGIINTPVSKENMKKVLNSLFCSKVSKVQKNNTQDILNNLMKKSLGNAKSINDKVQQDKHLINFCPYCGEKLNESFKEFKFCPYCGAKINI